jgi:hypothetical protein
LTILAPEFQATQEGTLHFEHLRSANGGLVRVARTLSEHVEQLNETLRNPQGDDVRRRRFVEAFVRPYGIDAPATPRVVDCARAAGRNKGARRWSVRRGGRRSCAPRWRAAATSFAAKRCSKRRGRRCGHGERG